jgi:hypothetical protein
MDFYRLASVKATIFVMDNKPINDIRKFLAPHMDIESVKWVANLAVSTIANHFAPGLDQALTGNEDYQKFSSVSFCGSPSNC